MHRALLICNSTYPEDPAKLPILLGPQVDGLQLWEALTNERTGIFERRAVSVLHERSQRDIQEAAEKFFAEATRGDVLLFYFSGHGSWMEDSLYLCARDTSSLRIRSTGISTDELSKMIATSDASAVVIVLDCCFSGGFKGVVTPNLGGEGRYVITATTSLSLANDATEPGAPSPFTAALIESISRGAEPHGESDFVDLDDLMRDLEARVPEDGPRPERDFDGSGRVMIARRPREIEASNAPPDQPPPLMEVQPLQPNFRGLVTFARQRGDLSLADVSAWKFFVLSGAASLICGFMTYRFGGNSLVQLLALYSAVVSVSIILFGLSEGLRNRWLGVARMRRRQVMESLSSRYPSGLAIWFWGSATLATCMVMSAAAGYGAADGWWVACLACLGLFPLVAIGRVIGRGDAVVIASAMLVVFGNLVPIYQRTVDSDFEYSFVSGAQSPSGIIWITIGLMIGAAWYWQSPNTVFVILTGLLFLSLTATIGNTLQTVHPHWIVTLCGSLALVVSLAIGASKPIPIQASPARPSSSRLKALFWRQ
jgi:hypothetical protein